MELAVLILAFGGIGVFALVLGLWGSVVSLRQRVRRAEVELAELDRNVTALSRLAEARVRVHQTPTGAGAQQPATPTPPIQPLTPTPPLTPPPPARQTQPARPTPAPIEPAEIAAAATTAPAADATADTWESVVGGNWFNKIGAAVLVLGIAYSVGYVDEGGVYLGQ